MSEAKIEIKEAVDTESLDKAAQAAAQQLADENGKIDDYTMRVLLTEARTHYGWQDKAVSDETLHRLYDIMKWGPTSMNQQPLRILFLRSEAEREKLRPALLEGNIPKTMSAPVTAVLCHDSSFYDNLPTLFPMNPNARGMFEANEEMAKANAFRNSTLQGAYFIIAARAVGLDCGPMSGFNNQMVDETLLQGTSWKSNFLCNLGYADTTKIFRRLPRLSFEEVAKIV